MLAWRSGHNFIQKRTTWQHRVKDCGCDYFGQGSRRQTVCGYGLLARLQCSDIAFAFAFYDTTGEHRVMSNSLLC